MDCVFCKIVNREIPADVELESDNVLVFKSIDPASSVHVLIVPKKHVANFMALADSDRQVLSEMTEIAQTFINKHNLSDGYKLIFNGGRYQAIPHLHWHVLAGNLQKDYYKKT